MIASPEMNKKNKKSVPAFHEKQTKTFRRR